MTKHATSSSITEDKVGLSGNIDLLQLLNYFVWLMVTDEGSVPEMRILLIKFDLKTVYSIK